MAFRIIIAGSRDFDDYKLLEKACDKLFKQYEAKFGKLEVVSGCARGADKLGERYAQNRNYYVKRFPADWDKHGPAAGPIRNKEMADYANACVVFYNGFSKGSKNMIETAKKKRMPIAVIDFNVTKIEK